MHEAFLRSETKKAAYFSIWILSTLMFAMGCFSMYMGFEDVYPQLMPILAGLLLIGVGITLICMNDPIDQLEIYKDRIEIKSLFGKTKQPIYRKEITSWTETDHRSKGKSWQALTLYLGEKKYSLSSNIYKNYDQIKEELVQGIMRDSELEQTLKKKKFKQAGLLFLSFGIFFLGLFFYNYSNKSKALSSTDLTRLEQVVTSPIAIHKGSKGKRSIRLRLKDYPDFKFEIDDNTFRATNAEAFVANVETGDTLFVDVITNDYQKKLTKEKELGFFDKTINYRTIDVYGLADKNNAYLSLQSYNENNQSMGDFRFWFWGILGAIGIVMGLVFLKRSAG
jgi:hypothetical protein